MSENNASLLVVCDHAGDIVWRAGSAMGVLDNTMGEAYLRHHPQVTDHLS